MTTASTITPAAATTTTSGGRAPTPQAWRLASAGALLTTTGLLGWQGGAWGAGAALVAALLLPWLLHGRHGGAAAGAGAAPDRHPAMPHGAYPNGPDLGGGRVGAEVMVSQVVPVWGQQLAATREAAASGLARLLDGFNQMAGALKDLSSQVAHSQVTLAPGALDQALADDGPARPALLALLAPSQRAFDQRDAAVAQLVNCSNAMQALRQLGRQARELGKHTRLVAFNATIEANRGGQGQDGGSQAVANETRMLATRIAEVGEQVERVVARLDGALTPERLRGEIGDTTPDELSQELALAARNALAALLQAMGGALRGSGEVQAAAQTLGNQLAQTVVHFQLGGRLDEMLDLVAGDMRNFAHWVAAHPHASQSDAVDWLAALETRYTLEEQRARHHGNVHIDRGGQVGPC